MRKAALVLFALLASTTIVAVSPSVKADTTDLWAVVVGVDGEDATHLDNDAMDFANVLTSVYGYPSSHVKLLTNEEATKTNVLSALDWLDNQESNSSGVSIFFSTHGSQDKIHLAGETYLYDTELSSAISQLESPSIFVAVCGCHSGSFLDVANSFPIGVLVTACESDELTYDIALYTNTIFVEFFVDRGMAQGLADADEDGRVTIEEAYRYAYNNCADPPGALTSTHPQIADKYPDEKRYNEAELYLQAPIENPWFTSVSLVLLATVLMLTYLRKKRNIKPEP